MVSAPRPKRATSQLTPTANTKRKDVPVRVRLTENILFVGSEMYYDSFWLKMMFIAASTVMARTFRKADRQSLAYVDVGYTRLEKLAIESLAVQRGFTVTRIGSTADLLALMNRDREDYALLDVAFFCHGLPGKISLNFWSSPAIELGLGNFAAVTDKAFARNGRILSYACRTGVLSGASSFSNDAEATPELSLAQRMADHFGIDVHAFLRRTFYGSVLRDKSQSSAISSALKQLRQSNEGQVIALPPDHEGLPHAGLAESLNPFSGPRREGTNGYALWRKKGGIGLPVAADSPEGLSSAMRVFSPQG